MFQQLHIKNLAIFEEFTWPELGSINVVIGENDTGKSHLLKLLYSVARSLQEKKRKTESAAGSWGDELARKLRWTFQPPDLELGRLVKKGTSKLRVNTRLCNENFYFAFGSSTTKQIRDANRVPDGLDELRALFFPPKEVLTSLDAIAATRETLEITGFGDHYFDLIKALRLPTTRGNIQSNLKQVLEELEALFAGEVRKEGDEFVFKRGNEKYRMSQTAEGIKKIGILTQLIRNRTINTGSILFFDEPEANLHPQAIVALADMLVELSRADIQIFLATHDYFILKALELKARQYESSIPICSLTKSVDGVEATLDDLQEGMPKNPILDVSSKLLNDDMNLSLATGE